ncbi:Copper transport protein [Aphelenchoides bicaudatus]|nr:Copper transport protein [Aphelenchoides bicaudatus]
MEDDMDGMGSGHMDMGNTTHNMHKMWMWFHTATQDTVLFDFWTVNTAAEMIWSCAIVFSIGFLLEALKYWRLLLERRSAELYSLPYQSKLFSGLHITQTVLFCINVALSYLLMLVFMTFSIWLGLAVVLGTALGFFVFGARPITFVPNSSDLKFVLSCIAVAVLGLLLELFKTFRLYLYRRSDNQERDKGCCSADIITNTATSYGATIPTSETSCECSSTEQPRPNSVSKFRPYSPKNLLDRTHQIQSALLFIQSFFSYSLMLVAMTYNSALFLSLIAGHTLGFFLTEPLFSPIEKTRIRVGDCCCE